LGTRQKYGVWVWGKKESDWGMALRVKSEYPSQKRNKRDIEKITHDELTL